MNTPQFDTVTPRTWFVLSYDAERGPRELADLVRGILGYSEAEYKPLRFPSIYLAGEYAGGLNLPAAHFRVAEYEYSATDTDGERVGECALDEALENGYTSLDFG